jgi:hypothetical protein
MQHRRAQLHRESRLDRAVELDEPAPSAFTAFRAMMEPRKGLLLLCLTTQITCASGLFTAPPGSTISCFPNPPFVAAFGDVSVISALIIEPSGVPVPDGTVAQFFTSLGRIDPEGKTKDGIVRVNFVSDSRSGTASITVVSGGPPAAPSASPSPGTGGASSGSGSCSTAVTIGSARPALVKVVPNPPQLESNRCTTVTATVYDANGNPVSNVPIIFSVSSPSEESFQSGGIPIFSDNNGQSSDVMCTRRSRDDPQTTVTVTATPPVGTPGTTPVTIN